MNYANFVEGRLAGSVGISANLIILQPAVAPYQLPPETGGTLVLTDSLGKPSQVEIIRYASRLGQELIDVERGAEGTLARDWPAGTYCYQSLTAGEFEAALARATTPRAELHATALLF